MAVDPRIVDAVLVILLLEAGVLWRRGRSGRFTLAPRDVLLTLLPGALLIAALRAALTPGGGAWVLLLLAASLPAHLADLTGRLRRARRSRSR